MPIHPVVLQWIGQRISSHVTTFGSDRFVDGRCGQVSSDVDIAVFLPKHCTRDAFFQVFEKDSLRCMFEDVVIVKHAFVPVVKFRYLQQAYDLVPICTHRCSTSVSAYTFADLVDEIDYRAFSAVVTTDVILSTIGPLRLACFKNALATIKNIARQEHVYSNPLGLLNGIALAVMLTSVFVTAPRERLLTTEGAVAMFFETYGKAEVLYVDLIDTSLSTTTATRRPMQVYIPVLIPPTPTGVVTHRINTLHNVGPAQFRRIRAFLNRSPELFRNPFTTSDFFIHFHVFANHEDFPRMRSQFESSLKRIVVDIEEPEWARVDVFSYDSPVFRSLKSTRTSFFLGVSFEEEKLDLLLGVISKFCVLFCGSGGHVCSDIFHRRALPSFVEF